jgi:hypothetical protein
MHDLALFNCCSWSAGNELNTDKGRAVQNSQEWLVLHFIMAMLCRVVDILYFFSEIKFIKIHLSFFVVAAFYILFG